MYSDLSVSNSDSYISGIISAHSLFLSWNLVEIAKELNKHIFPWANGHQYELKLSGSCAKGTGIVGTTDVDFFISLNPSVETCNSLSDVYTTLRNRFNGSGYTAKEQNVSIGINHTGAKVDLVAGVMQNQYGTDHSIWKRKAQTWTKTNVDHHVEYVIKSGRIPAIKAIKIWRKLRDLEFPSFYLELSVIEALKGKPSNGSISNDFKVVLDFLVNDFVDKPIFDPANQANEVSEELTQDEKKIIKAAASLTLKGNWGQAIW